MKYFYKKYYNLKSFKDRKIEADVRRNYDSTTKTGLIIKPMDQPDIYNLYYVPTNSTINLISEISKLDIMLDYMYEDLPGLAKRHFFIDMISVELQSTNELEGVRSSKEEIVETTKEILNENTRKKRIDGRFQSVIKSYFELMEGNLEPPINPNDFKRIYDEITADGISKEDYIDGKYFRKDITYVYKNHKEIHRGIWDPEDTEEAIVDKINQLTNFMNISSDDDLHEMIKIAIYHYYFEYIHPFYDGNGRTGRFISSIFIKKDYSWLTAMSLSQGCSKERRKYLDIFDKTNQISSQGEINYFVDEFLKIILIGQQDVLESLINKRDLLNQIMEKIGKDDNLDNEDEKNIMGIMAQEYHFNPITEGVGVEELEEVFDYTIPTIRKKLRKIHEKGLIEKIKGRPVKYIISKNYLEH